MGAYDQAHWETVVLELTPDKGVLQRGAVLSLGGAGKLDATTAGNEAQAFGVLLDASVDTGAKFSDGSVTGSIAKAGSFRGPALNVGPERTPPPSSYAAAPCGSAAKSRLQRCRKCDPGRRWRTSGRLFAYFRTRQSPELKAASSRKSAWREGSRSRPSCGPGGFWSGSKPSRTKRVRRCAMSFANLSPFSHAVPIRGSGSPNQLRAASRN